MAAFDRLEAPDVIAHVRPADEAGLGEIHQVPVCGRPVQHAGQGRRDFRVRDGAVRPDEEPEHGDAGRRRTQTG
jgi:hypothetical protein